MAAELEERLPPPQSSRLVGHHPPQPPMEVNHSLPQSKLNLFSALIESILLYNSVTWTMNKTLTKQLDSAYNRLLRYALNVSWKDKVTNPSIFGDDIIPVSQRLRQRRLAFIGHCLHSPESAPQPIADLVLWQPHPSFTRQPGRRSNNFRKTLCEETGYSEVELQDAVRDRVG